MVKSLTGTAINVVRDGILILIGVIVLASLVTYLTIAYYGILALETLELVGSLSLIITVFGIIIYHLFYYPQDDGEL